MNSLLEVFISTQRFSSNKDPAYSSTAYLIQNKHSSADRLPEVTLGSQTPENTPPDITIRITADPSIETLQTRREWQDILRK